MTDPRIIHISTGGPLRKMDLGGRDIILFEMHPHLGPLPVKSERDRSERKLSDKHYFWTAVSWWAQQGERLQPDGITCMFDKHERI